VCVSQLQNTCKYVEGRVFAQDTWIGGEGSGIRDRMIREGERGGRKGRMEEGR